MKVNDGNNSTFMSISHSTEDSLSISLSFCLSFIRAVCLSACLSACLSSCLLYYCLPFSVFLSVCLSLCLPACLLVCISVCLFVFLSVCLFGCLAVRLSVCLSVCLSADQASLDLSINQSINQLIDLFLRQTFLVPLAWKSTLCIARIVSIRSCGKTFYFVSTESEWSVKLTWNKAESKLIFQLHVKMATDSLSSLQSKCFSAVQNIAPWKQINQLNATPAMPAYRRTRFGMPFDPSLPIHDKVLREKISPFQLSKKATS